jgi:hypothetical protein
VVVARHAFVPSGVEARVQNGEFKIRFATVSAGCVAVDWPLRSENDRQPVIMADCPTRDDDVGVTAEMPRTPFEGARAPAILPHRDGKTTPSSPLLRMSTGGSSEDDAADEAPVGSAGLLRLLVSDSYESHQLRAQAVAASGKRMGPVFDVSPSQVSVIGRPSAAFELNGKGLVTYLASANDSFGFDVFGTPVSCAAR